MYSSQNPPVSPLNIVDGPRISRNVGFSEVPLDVEKKQPRVVTRQLRTNSDSSDDSIKGSNAPRKARFAEATSVNSPATGPGEHISPFARQAMTANMAHKPSDVGFGYISDNNPVEQHATVPVGYGAGGQPLKSAMKTPGTAARLINPLSPTFQEEEMLEREEEKTEKQQAADLKVKTRVRMAKMVLRGVNFSCSLIVLSMASSTFTIFNATKGLPPRNGLPAWAASSIYWPQIVVLSVAAVSLFGSVVVMSLYCRHGHKRAEKVAVYYTMFAMAYFVFSIVMWLVGAVVLQGTKATANGNDIWGWSCKDNIRRQYFQEDVHYALVCRMQDWSLVCCIIEIVVEVLVIMIYGVVFYRFYSKEKLRKSMDARDKARTDLYLAQLRSQSAPNTPGYAHTPRTPRFPTVQPMAEVKAAQALATTTPTTSAPTYTNSPQSAQTASPFRLQAPPTKISKTPQIGISPVESPTAPRAVSPPVERRNEHITAAPGEQVYEAVPIPGAYQPHINNTQ